MFANLKQVSSLLAAARRRRVLVRGTLRQLGRAITQPTRILIGSPSLAELIGTGERYCDPFELLAHSFPDSRGILRALGQEFTELEDELTRRYKRLEITHPPRFAAGRSTSLVLYAIVRIEKPECVVETGVANGHSTFFMLRALDKNGAGRLHSFDVSATVGGLLEPDDKRRWALEVLNGVRLRRAFMRAMDSIGQIDVFVHDSNHSRSWQTFEYGVALRRLRAKGLLASDDVDMSFAFSAFCARYKLSPSVLIDDRKAFGLVRVAGASFRQRR
jgi:predicted O-methyltransferase YrrM